MSHLSGRMQHSLPPGHWMHSSSSPQPNSPRRMAHNPSARWRCCPTSPPGGWKEAEEARPRVNERTSARGNENECGGMGVRILSPRVYGAVPPERSFAAPAEEERAARSRIWRMTFIFDLLDLLLQKEMRIRVIAVGRRPRPSRLIFAIIKP